MTMNESTDGRDEIINEYFSQFDDVSPLVNELLSNSPKHYMSYFIGALVNMGIFIVILSVEIVFGIVSENNVTTLFGEFVFPNSYWVTAFYYLSVITLVTIVSFYHFSAVEYDSLPAWRQSSYEIFATYFIPGPVVYKLLKPISNEKLVYHCLYNLWTADEEELDEVFEDVITVLNDPRIGTIHSPNQRITDFIDSLKKNPDYRQELVDNELESILIGIIEYKTDERINYRNDDLLSIEFTVDHLSKSVSELNRAYHHKLDDAIFVLARRLVEELVIYFYIRMGEGDRIANDGGRHFKMFSELQGQLEEDLTELQRVDDRADEGFIDDIGWVRDEGNSRAHSSQGPSREEKVMELKSRMQNIVDVFEALFKKTDGDIFDGGDQSGDDDIPSLESVGF